MTQVDANYEINNSDIAIISISGKFPGAKDIDSIWQNLRNGVESISSLTEQEILDSGVHPDLLNNSNYIKAQGVLSDIELFDANFFGYSAKEAEILYLQQRLFLESAWEALEKAGYDSQTYRLIGVYAGVGMNRYLHWIPGAHRTMLTDPHVPILAEKLRICIDKIQSHPE